MYIVHLITLKINLWSLKFDFQIWKLYLNPKKKIELKKLLCEIEFFNFHSELL
jgi:hypothetical protein